MKKGQGLSINVIIVAAIALLILILLALIFTGRIDIFNKSTLTCENNGGVCQPFCEDTQRVANQYSCAENEGAAGNVVDCCIG